MTELVPRLEASSNTAVGGRPGCRGAGGRRGFDVAARRSYRLSSLVHRRSREPSPDRSDLNGHRMGRMPQLGCRRLREPTVHVYMSSYMSRQGRTCKSGTGRLRGGPQSPTPWQRGRDPPPRAVLGGHERTARARHQPGCGPALTANCSGAEVPLRSPRRYRE